MTERASNKEKAPLPPIELQEWRGGFWRAVSAQAASEKHPQESQDIIRVNPELGLFVLCDGMGGHDDGREAALVVSEAIDEYATKLDWDLDDHELVEVLPNSMIKAIRHAQSRLWEEQERKSAGKKAEEPEAGTESITESKGKMDTTATAVFIRTLSSGGKIAIVGHVGNCRAYLVQKEGSVTQLTEDHDLMRTQKGAELVLGVLPPDQIDRRRREVRREMAEARSVEEMSEEARMLFQYRNRTSSVGYDDMSVDVDVLRFPDGCRLALMSDGVYENLGHRRTTGLLSSAPKEESHELARAMIVGAQDVGHRRPKDLPLAHADDMSVLMIESL